MRIGIMSDFHIEFVRGQMRGGARPQGQPTLGVNLSRLEGKANVLLLAGDIDIGSKAIDYAA